MKNKETNKRVNKIKETTMKTLIKQVQTKKNPCYTALYCIAVLQKLI